LKRYVFDAGQHLRGTLWLLRLPIPTSRAVSENGTVFPTTLSLAERHMTITGYHLNILGHF